MVTKTITVTEEAYNAIKGMKRGDESFSELFKRIESKPLRVKDMVGLLNDTPEEAEAFARRVRDLRKKASRDWDRRIANVRTRFKRSD